MTSPLLCKIYITYPAVAGSPAKTDNAFRNGMSYAGQSTDCTTPADSIVHEFLMICEKAEVTNPALDPRMLRLRLIKTHLHTHKIQCTKHSQTSLRHTCLLSHSGIHAYSEQACMPPFRKCNVMTLHAPFVLERATGGHCCPLPCWTGSHRYVTTNPDNNSISKGAS